MYIYIIKNAEMYKIGKTTNLKNRLSTLQVGSNTELELINSYKTDCPDTDEKTLHEIFAPKRERGEWFKLDNKDLNKIEKYFEKIQYRIKVPNKELKRLKSLKQAEKFSEEYLIGIYIKNLANKENKQFAINQEEKDFLNQRATFYSQHYKLLTDIHLDILTELLFAELSKCRIKDKFNKIQTSDKYLAKQESDMLKTLLLLDERINTLKNRLNRGT